MANTANERFLRYILLLGKGSLFVLRRLLEREVAKGHHTLEEVLENNRHRFVWMIDKQRETMFPTQTSVNTDIDSWDIAILYHVLTKVFKRQLNRSEISALNVLKTSRDDIYAHTDQMEMSSDDFEDNFNDLEVNLKQLASGLGRVAVAEIHSLVEASESGCIDTGSAMQSLKEMNEFEREILKNLNRKLSDIEDKLSQQIKVQEENKSLLNNMSTIQGHFHQDVLDVKSTTHDINDKVQDLTNTVEGLREFMTRMYVHGPTEEIKEKASSMICNYIKKVKNEKYFAQSGIKDKIDKIINLDPNVNLNLLTAIFGLLDDITNNPDVEIGEVASGSVLICLRCTSMRGLLKHMLFMGSKECQQRLSEISIALKDVLGISCSLTWTIEHESLLTFLHGIESTDKQNVDIARSKVVNLPIRHTSLNGLDHMWNLLEDGTFSKHMKRISTIISEDVGEEVTVSFSVDMEQFINAVLKARPTAIGGSVHQELYFQGNPEVVTLKTTSSDTVDFISRETRDELLAITINTVFLTYFALRNLSKLYGIICFITMTNMMIIVMQRCFKLFFIYRHLQSSAIQNSVFILGYVESVEAQGYLGTSKLNEESSENTSEESETDEDEESDND